ncbi:amidohydrolase [Sedimentitalea sp. JM2-8]|uniref:Amidohydrolase n=1 Tax=Sedimentitalea xiamensis TaxID=3050037 RepID=A0ABT7FKQ3_9RHOB|nr:amidohydrolase [Sedimentitalea xiamensis]MDK3075737.1 amidohydrolase [Sedimentitalea xiamensis]
MKFTHSSKLLAASMLLAGATSAPLAQEAADIVFTNANIHTMDEDNPTAQAVAISGNTISYVGDDAGIQSLIGDDTRVIDAQGHLMVPGFIESHSHLLVAAAAISGVIGDQRDDADNIARKVVDYATENPGDWTIFGTGLAATLLQSDSANREILDEVLPDRGIVLLDETNHNAWVNSKALELAGVTKDTPDPAGGTYVKDENGELTGIIQGSPAHIPVINASKAVTPEGLAASLPNMLEIMTSFGFTGALDMGFPLGTEAGYQALVDLDNEGKLPIRVSLAYMFNTVDLGKKVLATIEEFSQRFSSEHVWLDTLKIVGDGVTENFKAYFFEPYLDHDGSGAMNSGDEFTREAAIQAADMGFNVTTHCVGDRCNALMLDIYEEIRAAGNEDAILSTTHSWWVRREDRPRWAEANVITQTAGIWLFYRPQYATSLGQERNDTEQFPMRDWADSGAVIALGSDYPATDGGLMGLNPFNNIYSLLTRQLAPPLVGSVGEKHDPLGPADQVLTIDEAVRAYSEGSAKMMGRFDEFGSITEGKKADLIVLSQNLYEIDVEDISNTDVLLTMMDGNITYAEPGIVAGILADLDIFPIWTE